MTRRTASWIAWPACGLAVAASAGSLARRFAEGAQSSSIQTFSLLFALAFPVIGAVIATRRPGNRIGWIFVAVGVSFAAATLSSEYASYALITREGTVALVDRGRLETGVVTSSGSSSVFAGFRFPPEVISVAVRWYLRYGLSYRDVEELLAERGVIVDHVSVYRWVQRFTPEFAEAARPCRHAPGDRWFVDETYVKVAGKWAYLYRAVDQHGQVVDVLLSIRRDLVAARRFFTRALQAGTIPVEVTTIVPPSTRGSSMS
jgi:hypothetical protein